MNDKMDSDTFDWNNFLSSLKSRICRESIDKEQSLDVPEDMDNCLWFQISKGLYYQDKENESERSRKKQFLLRNLVKKIKPKDVKDDLEGPCKKQRTEDYHNQESSFLTPKSENKRGYDEVDAKKVSPVHFSSNLSSSTLQAVSSSPMLQFTSEDLSTWKDRISSSPSVKSKASKIEIKDDSTSSEDEPLDSPSIENICSIDKKLDSSNVSGNLSNISANDHTDFLSEVSLSSSAMSDSFQSPKVTPNRSSSRLSGSFDTTGDDIKMENIERVTKKLKKKRKATVDEVEEVGNYFDQMRALDQEKSDMKFSAAQLNIEFLKRYIRKSNVDIGDPLKAKNHFKKAESKEIRTNLIEISSVVCPSASFSDTLTSFHLFHKYKFNEAEVRLFLDSILKDLCLKAGVTVKLEESMFKPGYLPESRCDYTFYKDGLCIGTLEAKSPSRLNKNAVPQFLVELLNLQAKYSSSKLSFFGILVDGYRFVFIKLSGTKFQFEGQKNGDEAKQIEQIYFHKTDSWNDLFENCGIILDLFESSGFSLKSGLVENR